MVRSFSSWISSRTNRILPVSSSGHLAIGSALFGLQGEENLTFAIAVHAATVLSTIVILWKEIEWLFKGFSNFNGMMKQNM